MTHDTHASPAVPHDAAARSNADYRWTTVSAAAFLGALADLGMVSQAARGVGMSNRLTACARGRGRAASSRAWDQALEEGRARRRARRRGAGEATPLPSGRDIFGLGR